jgi:uncharacterized protein (DUF2062 family)
MPRNVIRQLGQYAQRTRDHWYARPFTHIFTDSRLWSLQRRNVTAAFGAGLAICFVPLPIHVPLALMTAMLWRLNVPTLVATVFLVNPLTALPTFYLAYTVGRLLLQLPPVPFQFELSWDWLQHGLGPLWKPLLVGCLVCAATVGISGRFLLDRFWMWRVREKYRTRGSDASD